MKYFSTGYGAGIFCYKANSGQPRYALARFYINICNRSQNEGGSQNGQIHEVRIEFHNFLYGAIAFSLLKQSFARYGIAGTFYAATVFGIPGR